MSEGYYAQIETSFILNDARCDEMTNTQFRIYITLWAYAVDQRRSTLKFPNLCRTLARLSRNDPRTIAPALAKLRELCLIELPYENTVTVCGVESKHSKLKWKQTDLQESQGVAIKTHKIREDKSTVDKIRVDKIILPDKSAPPKPIVKKADPNHKIIIEHWMVEYEKKFKIKYGFDGGKDGQIIKTLLLQFGFDLLKPIITEFFNSEDQFIKHKTGFTIPGLKLKANQVAQSIATPPTPMDNLSPAGQITAKNMKRVLDRMDREEAENAKIGQN